MTYVTWIDKPEVLNGEKEMPYWAATRNADFYGRAYQDSTGGWVVEVRQGKKDVRILEGADELTAIYELTQKS